MTVKTYKLKLNIPQDRSEILQWIWLSHQKFNEGVRYLLHQLFLMRRGKGWTRSDGTFIPNIELLERFKVDGKNEKQAAELAEVCRKVYEHIFPKSSSESDDDEDSQTGRAQDIARSLYGPLTDPEATGLGVESNEKIHRALRKAIENPESVKDSELLRFPEGGRSPRHYKLFLDWQSKGMKPNSQLREDFIKAAKKYLESRSDNREAEYRRNIAHLRESLGGKIFNPARVYLGLWDDENTPPENGSTSEWERGMFVQAIERLLTHEGWAHRRKRERETAELKLKHDLEGYWESELEKDDDGKPIRMLVESAPKNPEGWKLILGVRATPWFVRLQEYQIQRTREDAVASRQGAKNEVKISGAMLKGWKPIRERLKKAIAKGMVDRNGLIRVLNQYQMENPRRFGDGRFFRWLLEEENRFLWVGEEDYVGRFASLAVRKFKRITWTMPDAIKHPLWIRFGDTSAVKYSLNPAMDQLTMELLAPHPTKKNVVVRKKVSGIAVAPYEKFLANFRMLPFEPSGKRKEKKEKKIQSSTEMVYQDPFVIGRTASLSGGRLMFERSELEKRCDGFIPTPYLSLSCEIGEVETSAWEKKWLRSRFMDSDQFPDPLRKEIRIGEPG